MYELKGKAAWKFHLLTGKIIYRNSNITAIKWFTDNVMYHEFDVYSRGKPWDFVASRRLTKKCECGQYYDQTMDGSEFRWVRQHCFEMNMKELRKFFASPILCQRCYYYEEWKNGLWTPQFYKKQFEE